MYPMFYCSSCYGEVFCRRDSGKLNFSPINSADGGDNHYRLRGRCLKPVGCVSAPLVFHKHDNERDNETFIVVVVVVRPHRSTTYVDAAYFYRPSSVVCRSVCRSVCLSVCHTSEPCKNGCTDQAAVWVEDLGGP